jgi:hypothetical protein
MPPLLLCLEWKVSYNDLLNISFHYLVKIPFEEFSLSISIHLLIGCIFKNENLGLINFHSELNCEKKAPRCSKVSGNLLECRTASYFDQYVIISHSECTEKRDGVAAYVWKTSWYLEN